MDRLAVHRDAGSRCHSPEAPAVILVDTGPIVALFDPKDTSHRRCRDVLKSLREPLVTTVPVLTEASTKRVPGRTTCRRRAPLPDASRLAIARCPAPIGSPERFSREAQGTERGHRRQRGRAASRSLRAAGLTGCAIPYHQALN